MAKIKNIEELRDFALETLDKLSRGDIDTAEAGVTGKLCEGVIATVKTQMEYARMLQEEPAIPFMKNGGSGRQLGADGKTVTLLEAPKKRPF